MTAHTLFYIFISIIILEFLWDSFLEFLNAQHYADPIPQELEGVFNSKEYLKSQAYKKENYHFSLISSLFSLIATLGYFFYDGFAWLDQWVRSFTDNTSLQSMLFIGILLLANSLISLPFSYYHTFVIEEKFGFNKSTQRTFWLDLLKGLMLSLVLGGIILWAVLWFYTKTGDSFWLYTWVLIGVFSIFINLFYSTLIVPLFNKQTPLEDGKLKDAIEAFAKKTGFKLHNIFVIDGSKRSTKANAYFAGFGPKKRIVLYDTLIKDLDTNEIVAVLAHEVGHYQKKHTLLNLILSLANTGITLYILSLFINSKLLAAALGVDTPSFHIGSIAFGILYSPLSELTGVLMNFLSRKFEYQADAYAKTNYNASLLITALKKLSKNALSNLTPHPLYVFMHYSHPTLLQRIKKLQDQ
ncbi:MAG TPA: M48 family peptidase [Saprospiraceae bacterium]|nr:M48 family peptidase [Saprospiraceae bacterium]